MLNTLTNNLSTLISHQWVQGEAQALTSSTPDEREVVWQKNASSTDQVNAAVQSARDAQAQWGNTSIDARVAIIQKFADILKERQAMMAQAIALETGKPLWEATAEVSGMIAKAAVSLRAQQERAGTRQTATHALNHQAHGVMAVFGPFNFPGHLPNGHIIPALLAGNTVVFKPSELTPAVAELSVQAWLDAGLPKGVINLVQGGKAVGQALVSAPVDGVLFTGSCATGKAIHQQLAGRPEVLLALEMGGNNPLIVGDVNHLDAVANTILHSAFLSAGQRCTCTRRLIIVESETTDALIEKLVSLSQRIIVGDGEQPAFMGPVIDVKSAKNLLAAQEHLIERGAKVHQKMTPINDSMVYLTPGIIDVTSLDDVADEEYFGPLLQIFRVKDFEAAMASANATKFGLAAGVLSDVPAQQQHFQKNIKAGVISINLPTAGASSELPFGGIGASGNHRPSAYYAADYCAWPQAATLGDSTQAQGDALNLATIRGLR